MPTVGDPAPNFTGNDFVNGGTFNLSAFAGKIIVLSFLYKG
jgi:peroxiredoxin